MKEPTDWLLASSPWVQYRTRVDLLGQTERNTEVKTARRAMLDHPQVRVLASELGEWPGPTLSRHNDASHLLHKLVFIADLGLRATDPGVDRIVDRVLAHQSAQGMFQVKVNIPTHFGGTGKDQFEWLRMDQRLGEMAVIVQAKADEEGRFTPESIWQARREWDFGQKCEPSAWLTLGAWRISRRVNTL